MHGNDRWDDTTGLILAGGYSRRFGSDKVRYPIEGRTMIRHVYDTLAPLLRTIFVSVRDEEQRLDLPVRKVPDRFPGAGPLAGIHAGMIAAETPWLLVVAADMPFITREVLETLLSARSEAFQPVVARSPDGRRQPLCACYPTQAANSAGELLDSGRRAMHEFLSAFGTVTEVPVPGEAVRNVNYPDDL